MQFVIDVNDYMLLDLDKIVESKNIPTFIRMLASQIRSEGTLTPGKFFNTLGDRDLNDLSQMVENANWSTEEPEENSLMIVLLGILLAQAEGFSIASSESKVPAEQNICLDLLEVIHLTVVFTSIESLYRKGLVDIDYRGFTYDPHTNNVIAKRKDV